MRDRAANVLRDFVLTHLEREPLSKRAALYEALAEVSLPAERSALHALATECLKFERAHQQLVLDFRRKGH